MAGTSPTSCSSPGMCIAPPRVSASFNLMFSENAKTMSQPLWRAGGELRMSNGSPEPFEEKIGKPLGVPATLAFAYTVLWTAVAVVYWIVPLRFPGWVLWPSLGLLAVSLAVIFQGFRQVEENES